MDVCFAKLTLAAFWNHDVTDLLAVRDNLVVGCDLGQCRGSVGLCESKHGHRYRRDREDWPFVTLVSFRLVHLLKR